MIKILYLVQKLVFLILGLIIGVRDFEFRFNFEVSIVDLLNFKSGVIFGGFYDEDFQ